MVNKKLPKKKKRILPKKKILSKKMRFGIDNVNAMVKYLDENHDGIKYRQYIDSIHDFYKDRPDLIEVKDIWASYYQMPMPTDAEIPPSWMMFKRNLRANIWEEYKKMEFRLSFTQDLMVDKYVDLGPFMALSSFCWLNKIKIAGDCSSGIPRPENWEDPILDLKTVLNLCIIEGSSPNMIGESIGISHIGMDWDANTQGLAITKNPKLHARFGPNNETDQDVDVKWKTRPLSTIIINYYPLTQFKTLRATYTIGNTPSQNIPLNRGTTAYGAPKLAQFAKDSASDISSSSTPIRVTTFFNRYPFQKAIAIKGSEDFSQTVVSRITSNYSSTYKMYQKVGNTYSGQAYRALSLTGDTLQLINNVLSDGLTGMTKEGTLYILDKVDGRVNTRYTTEAYMINLDIYREKLDETFVRKESVKDIVVLIPVAYMDKLLEAYSKDKNDPLVKKKVLAIEKKLTLLRSKFINGSRAQDIWLDFAEEFKSQIQKLHEVTEWEFEAEYKFIPDNIINIKGVQPFSSKKRQGETDKSPIVVTEYGTKYIFADKFTARETYVYGKWSVKNGDATENACAEAQNTIHAWHLVKDDKVYGEYRIIGPTPEIVNGYDAFIALYSPPNKRLKLLDNTTVKINENDGPWTELAAEAQEQTFVQILKNAIFGFLPRFGNNFGYSADGFYFPLDWTSGNGDVNYVYITKENFIDILFIAECSHLSYTTEDEEPKLYDNDDDIDDNWRDTFIKEWLDRYGDDFTLPLDHARFVEKYTGNIPNNDLDIYSCGNLQHKLTQLYKECLNESKGENECLLPIIKSLNNFDIVDTNPTNPINMIEINTAITNITVMIEKIKTDIAEVAGRSGDDAEKKVFKSPAKAAEAKVEESPAPTTKRQVSEGKGSGRGKKAKTEEFGKKQLTLESFLSPKKSPREQSSRVQSQQEILNTFMEVLNENEIYNLNERDALKYLEDANFIISDAITLYFLDPNKYLSFGKDRTTIPEILKDYPNRIKELEKYSGEVMKYIDKHPEPTLQEAQEISTQLEELSYLMSRLH